MTTVEKALQGNRHFDVCIIGAGPAGLSVLAALHAPYSLDGGVYTDAQRERAIKSIHRKQRLRVCVIDSHDEWLGSWKKNFELLDIKYLRSPTLAHPDMFDPNSLLTYAVLKGREDELLESGCGDIKSLQGLGQTQVGLWKLPSTSLFVDFCDDLARPSSLPHIFIGRTAVVDIVQRDKNIMFTKSPLGKKSNSSTFELTLRSDDVYNLNTNVSSAASTQFTVSAASVVLALGPTGRPIIPPSIYNAPKWRLWDQPEPVLNNNHDESNGLPVLVVGGGLTAIQVALQEVKINNSKHGSVILCSRRPLVSQHFDISVDWFNHRKTNKCMADLFYDRPIKERVAALKEARNGGSIPPLYMEQIRRAEQDGSLMCVVGNVEYDSTEKSNDELGGLTISLTCDGDEFNGGKTDNTLTFQVKQIILACGMKPTCGSSECPPTSLIGKIMSRWPVRCESGLPCVTQDLRWKDELDLFVVGALGALNGGPDSGNIMGMRRAAQLVANALDCHSWLRETALVNPFEAFMDDYESSDSDDDEDGDERAGAYSSTRADKNCVASDSSTESESCSMSSSGTYGQ